jgi:hypothetical protein
MGTAIFLRSKWAPVHQKETRICAQFLNASSTFGAQALIYPGASMFKQLAAKPKTLSVLALGGLKSAAFATRPATTKPVHWRLGANGDRWIADISPGFCETIAYGINVFSHSAVHPTALE